MNELLQNKSVGQVKPKYEEGAVRRKTGSYNPPIRAETTGLSELVYSSGRAAVDAKQLQLLSNKIQGDVIIYWAGNIDLLKQKTVAIVGSRASSLDGQRRASRLARELASHNISVSSGLAKGIDTAALESAVASGGNVIGVIGTPLDKAYPAQNKRLQEAIYSKHLLLTPFMNGQRVYPSNFPQRNRVMALLSDATVIIEASDTSGTLHQAAECVRQGRLLFIAKSVIDNKDLNWPKKFLGESNVKVLESTLDIVDSI